MIENFGQDGSPHLTYFDKDTGLSFVWDLEHRARGIAVSHGGYGEGVIDIFPFQFEDIERIETYLVAFRRACQTYVQAWNTRLSHE